MDVVSSKSSSINERTGTFELVADVYNYRDAPATSLVVVFANKHIGGGCFNLGFVQEEQMVAQSTDFAICLSERREHLSSHEVATFGGVYFDAWWPREEAGKKMNMSAKHIKEQLSKDLVIVAVDAPDKANFRRRLYDSRTRIPCTQALHVLLYLERVGLP